MSVLIQLFNPSGYPRRGNVILPWKKVYESLQVNADELLVEDDAGNMLSCQIDIVDPKNRELDLLIIGLVKNIPPGADDYSYASSSLSIKKGNVRQQIKEESDNLKITQSLTKKGLAKELIFANELMKISFNLTPYLNNENEYWYSGCATNVLLHNIEMLDIGNWIEHDKEKRCMQVDQVIIPSPPWQGEKAFSVDIHNKHYNVLTINNNGLNRVSATVATEPFDYVFMNHDGRKESRRVSLFRIISLERYADYIFETLFLNVEGGTSLRFKARYFSYLNTGFDTETYFFPHVPDWLAIGNNRYSPYNGYGFATDVHNENFISPHAGFPCAKNASKTYSWTTGDSVQMNCIHHFIRGQTKRFDDCSGRSWYEKIYKPIKAKITTR